VATVDQPVGNSRRAHRRRRRANGRRSPAWQPLQESAGRATIRASLRRRASHPGAGPADRPAAFTAIEEAPPMTLGPRVDRGLRSAHPRRCGLRRQSTTHVPVRRRPGGRIRGSHGSPETPRPVPGCACCAHRLNSIPNRRGASPHPGHVHLYGSARSRMRCLYDCVDPSPHEPVGHDRHPTRIDGGHQVVQNPVRHILMESTFIAVAP
jgi:hypothetical protein